MTTRNFTRAHNDYLDSDRPFSGNYPDDYDPDWEDYEEIEAMNLEDQLEILLFRGDREDEENGILVCD